MASARTAARRMHSAGAGYFCDTDVTQLCLPTEANGAPCVQVRLQ